MAGPQVVTIDAEGDLLLKVPNDNSSDGSSQAGNHGDGFILIRVSSKVLARESIVFKLMIDGPFREAKLKRGKGDPPPLEVPEEGAFGMVLLCQILHGDPRAKMCASLEQIIEISSLSNRWACQEASRDWFHYQLIQRPGHWARLPPEDFGSLIGSCFNFGASEAFYLSTLVAIGYFSWTPDTEESVRRGIGGSLPDRFAAFLRECRRAHMEFIAPLWAELRRQLYNPGQTQVRCKRQHRRFEMLSATLLSAGLSENSPEATSLLTMDEAFNKMQRLAEHREFNNENRCAVPSCASCSCDWRSEIEAQVRLSRIAVCGLCLDCVKSRLGGFSTFEWPGPCVEHPAPDRMLVMALKLLLST